MLGCVPGSPQPWDKQFREWMDNIIQYLYFSSAFALSECLFKIKLAWKPA